MPNSLSTDQSGVTINTAIETPAALTAVVAMPTPVALVLTPPDPLVISLIVGQGPSGPGTGDPTFEPILHLDTSRPIAYAATASQIKRLNYSSYPPVVTSHTTNNMEADWPNRTSLTYA